MITKVFLPLLCATLAVATLEVRSGLLARLVQHYKQEFLQDLVNVAPIQVNVTIERAPPGYIDSAAWDYDSVIRLIGLIRGSEENLPKPVRRALREFLQPLPVPSRRYGGRGHLHKARMRAAARLRRCQGDPKKPGYPKNCPRQSLRRARAKLVDARKNALSRLYVPSFSNPNDLYYDEMIEVGEPPEFSMVGPEYSGLYNSTLQDNNIVVISNPVEARLPSGHISIGTLRRILEARAEAARVMPTRPTSTLQAAEDNKTTVDDRTTVGGNSTGTGATGNVTGGTGDTGATGGAAGGETTAAGADAAAEGGEAPKGDGE